MDSLLQAIKDLPSGTEWSYWLGHNAYTWAYGSKASDQGPRLSSLRVIIGRALFYGMALAP